MSFDKISLGKNNKYYTHPLSFDVNTTFDFGHVHPKCHFYMDDGDSIKSSFSEILRLAPLPVPTMGNVYEETYTRFVPVVQLCPWAEFIRSKKPYTFNSTTVLKPERVPQINNAMLVNYLINKCCNVRRADLTGEMTIGGYTGDFEYDADTDTNLIQEDLKKFYVAAGMRGDYFATNQSGYTPDYLYRKDITLLNADFIIPVDKHKLLLFKLTRNGRHVRKILIGMGYGLNINDTEPVSMLPLLAFYKAWFDTYNPARILAWQQSACYKLIKYMESDYPTSFCDYGNLRYFADPNITFRAQFLSFMQSLYDTYTTETLNFISAHRDNPSNDLDYTFTALSSSTTDPTTVTVNGSDGSLTPITQGNVLSDVAIRLLARVTRFVNKDSVIGNKINTWLKIHGYGDLANVLLRDSNKCSYHRMSAPISAVFSTSDTATSDGNGEYLGAYAGKSLGELQNQMFNFTAPSAGFFVVLSAVVADSNFCNGNDGFNYCVDRDTMFIDEYDGMGYEVTSKNQLFGDCGFGYNPDAAMKNNLNDSGFGFVPRYSRMKQKRNIVNGDMSLRGTMSTLSPYYLDKIISNVVVTVPSDGKCNIDYIAIPEASEEWQYFNKYPYLGNPDRIFYNSGNETTPPDDDNFISQTVFRVVLRNKLKPISESYDTFDESHDTTTVNVQQS